MPAVLQLTRCLQEKLAVAQSNRNSSLEERRIKANLVLQRSLEVSLLHLQVSASHFSVAATQSITGVQAAGRLSERQNERAARLDAKLEQVAETSRASHIILSALHALPGCDTYKALPCWQAERVRELQIAAAAARGGEAAAHAKAVSAAARAREEADAARRRTDLELRLQRAVDARHELTQTVLASLAPVSLLPSLRLTTLQSANASESRLPPTFHMGASTTSLPSISTAQVGRSTTGWPAARRGAVPGAAGADPEHPAPAKQQPGPAALLEGLCCQAADDQGPRRSFYGDGRPSHGSSEPRCSDAAGSRSHAHLFCFSRSV